MSSTNRSNARDKHIADYYVTPQECVEVFLKQFIKDHFYYPYQEEEFKNFEILDPCAGGDINTEMTYPAVLYKLGCKNINTIDIREDSPAGVHGDFIQMPFSGIGYDLIITNPPFNIAQDIINKSLELCKEGGYVIMLLRLNYFGGKVRQDFWKKNMPYRTYVHNRRMSFTPDGKTDSIEYMHCVWKKGYSSKETILKMIYDF